MRDCKHGRMARKCEVCELEEEVNELRAQLTEAQQQCQQLLAERSKYGVMISYALQGQRHSDEPDGDHRLDAIRAMAATLSDCQHRLAAAEQAEPVAYAAFADNGNIRIW